MRGSEVASTESSWAHLRVLLQRPKRGIEVLPRVPDRAAHEASGTAPPAFFTSYDHPVGVFASLVSAHGGLQRFAVRLNRDAMGAHISARAGVFLIRSIHRQCERTNNIANRCRARNPP